MTDICRNCLYAVQDGDTSICMGQYQGEDITLTLDRSKACFEERLEDYIERAEASKRKISPQRSLKDMKVDGRKNIEIVDRNGVGHILKAGLAKKLFPNLIVIQVQTVGVMYDKFFVLQEMKIENEIQ